MDDISIITPAIWVMPMKELCSPLFNEKDHGQGAGIPAWIMAFAYICGLIHNSPSINQNARFFGEAPLLQQLLSGQKISQCAFSRFLAKPFRWQHFSFGRLSRLQEQTETRLQDGDVIALDDTKIEHPKIPFLCWLFDSSDKRHVWCMNLVLCNI